MAVTKASRRFFLQCVFLFAVVVLLVIYIVDDVRARNVLDPEADKNDDEDEDEEEDIDDDDDTDNGIATPNAVVVAAA